MKCSETWLREWIKTDLSLEAIGERLTMAGLEMESIDPVASPFKNVVVGEVVAVKPHPDAEKLTLCEVNIGKAKPLAIVCGAPNVRTQLKVAVAQIGATLANNIEIKPSTIRGAASEGMLCSGKELGLSDDQAGILELPVDAKVGDNLWDYLALNDKVIDISITPNRGDCLSMLGVAREISALIDKPITKNNIPPVAATTKNTIPVTNRATDSCPHYYGRVINKVNAAKKSPVWLQERLRRAGVRSISAVVDVTNYVMLELGQPMHAFDLDKINKEIIIRTANANEKISLLDGSDKVLDAETLVIADAQNPLAIAGVMGGMPSCVTDTTQHIFLESAYFKSETVARSRQHYQLTSESAYRFERGVDPALQKIAIERATQLILELVGGEAGPIIDAGSPSSRDLITHTPSCDLITHTPSCDLITHTSSCDLITHTSSCDLITHTSSCDLITGSIIPTRTISLAFSKIKQVLGIDISVKEVEGIFTRLGFTFTFNDKEKLFNVTIPSYRFDLTLPEDLIEEVARLYGYNNIPIHTLHAALTTKQPEQDWFAARELLADLGYQEIVSYSFVDTSHQAQLNPAHEAKEIANPITSDMAVMRTNLWPGLVTTLKYNQSRQQTRIRLMEVGICFTSEDGDLSQQPRLAGLIAGSAMPEQWGIPSRHVDFYDLKGDVETLLLALTGSTNIDFQPETHPALHPGQAAAITLNGQKIGLIGTLHPKLIAEFDVIGPVILFEIDLNKITNKKNVQFREISKFPEIRRDLSILINEAVPASNIQDTIKNAAGAWLKDIFIFDVYQGKGVADGMKSIALAMIFQHPERTLVDEEVVGLVDQVVTALQGRYDAHLRS